ncbi:MAG: hypothetical protein H7840_00240 [Alphaproteobacteria bacterium]
MTRHEATVRQIEFWREVTNSVGVRGRATLMTVDIAEETPDPEAVEEAIRRFCAFERVSDWRRLADGYDVRVAGAVSPRMLVPWLDYPVLEDIDELIGDEDENEDEDGDQPRRMLRQRASLRTMRRPVG